MIGMNNNKKFQLISVFLISICLIQSINALPCENPRDGMTVTKDTMFCKGTFNLPNGIIVNPRVMLNCNGAVLNQEVPMAKTGIKAGSGSQIKNCVIKGYTYGIQTYGNSNLFIGNTFEDNYHGIHLSEGANKITIRSNKFEDNYDIGVYGYNVNENQILSNTFYSNGKGIYLHYGHKNVIWGNSIKSSYAGAVYLYGGVDNQVVNNVLSGNGHNWNQGGGILTTGDITNIAFNSITNNYIGLEYERQYPVTLVKNTISNNYKDIIVN